jgi:hypothetical protein
MFPERQEALDKWAQYVESFVEGSNIVALKQVS